MMGDVDIDMQPCCWPATWSPIHFGLLLSTVECMSYISLASESKDSIA